MMSNNFFFASISFPTHSIVPTFTNTGDWDQHPVFRIQPVRVRWDRLRPMHFLHFRIGVENALKWIEFQIFSPAKLNFHSKVNCPIFNLWAKNSFFGVKIEVNFKDLYMTYSSERKNNISHKAPCSHTNQNPVNHILNCSAMTYL